MCQAVFLPGGLQGGQAVSSVGGDNSQVKKCVWFQVEMDVHRKITQRKGLQLIAPNDLSVGPVGGPSVRRPQLRGVDLGALSVAEPQGAGVGPGQRASWACSGAQTTRVSVLVTRGGRALTGGEMSDRSRRVTAGVGG